MRLTMKVTKVSDRPRTQHGFLGWFQKQTPHLLPLALVLAGFLLRFGLAWFTFLNPDEILHCLLADQPSLRQAYQASLTTAHPPLLILFLHYWQMLSPAEWLLRLPSVLAGIAFCWITFLWLNKAVGRSAALTGLVLLLFSPSLIHLSSEVRQYALLLCFSATDLYFLESALAEKSARMMMLSFAALYLALLTHYSALIFALSLGIYGLIRLFRQNTAAVVITWIVGQLIAVALCVFLYLTHISRLKRSGQPLEIETWLGSSIYHPGHDHLVVFVFRTTIRLFHFLFSQGAVGVLGFLLFLIGIAGLSMGEPWFRSAPGKPSSRQLALLLVLPFVVNCALAVAGLYPYGGTRHNAVLAGFAMSGIAIGFSPWMDHGRWSKPLLVALGLVLVICNVFPNPAGAYIRPRDQSRELMEESVRFVRHEIPPGSVLFADNGGGLSLSYYFCHQRVMQYELPFQPFLQSNCSGLHVITLAPNFRTLPDRSALGEIDPYTRSAPAPQIWFFQAGWIAGKEDIRRTLSQTGCHDPRRFGRNILLCQL
jgi:4-amino-4-deoxy-L-arabinose transferase-like glycosyltransferase